MRSVLCYHHKTFERLLWLVNECGVSYVLREPELAVVVQRSGRQVVDLEMRGSSPPGGTSR